MPVAGETDAVDLPRQVRRLGLLVPRESQGPLETAMPVKKMLSLPPTPPPLNSLSDGRAIKTEVE